MAGQNTVKRTKSKVASSRRRESAPRKTSIREFEGIEYSIQQVGIDEQTWWSMVLLTERRSQERGRKIPVRETHVAALRWFLQRHAAGGTARYYAAAVGTPIRTVWLDCGLVTQATALAQTDRVQRNRILHTAFVEYLKDLSFQASAAEIEKLKGAKGRATAAQWRGVHKAIDKLKKAT
jgi:hypothetical protein